MPAGVSYSARVYRIAAVAGNRSQQHHCAQPMLPQSAYPNQCSCPRVSSLFMTTGALGPMLRLLYNLPLLPVTHELQHPKATPLEGSA